MVTVRELRAKGHALSPTLQVGKAGITAELILQLKQQLKTKKLVKVRLLKSSLTSDSAEMAANLAAKSGSVIVQQIGNVLLLYKAQKKEESLK